MPARNFKRRTASLRKFLQTGELGPISFDLTMLDVAALIGPPTWWATDVHDFPVPLYWGYSNLEISFSLDQPHPIESFKINPLRNWGLRFHSFCPLFRLSMDALPIQGRPSDLLRSGIWDIDGIEIDILANPQDPKLCIRGAGIEILYVVFDSEAEEYFSGIESREPDRASLLLDEHAVLHGLYANRDTTSSVKWPTESWQPIPAREYLKVIGNRRDSQAVERGFS